MSSSAPLWPAPASAPLPFATAYGGAARAHREARLDMVKDNLCRCRYRFDGKLRAHHEYHIQIVWHLCAGHKAAPQKHAGKLSRRLCEGHQALELLPQPLPACRGSGEAHEDLVFCGHVDT